ncbi:MAG: poly-beta-1,6 N-acetyl-D-glucosamine synthase [Coriobacteriia bacterium]|nr:poly-beta-1,6 N-acetyl-D-glucosamine synthase [Coriobacteriia bacterium]
MLQVVQAIADNPVYIVMTVFFALYPLFTSIMWAVTAVICAVRRERPSKMHFYEFSDEELPSVTVVIPAHFEGRIITNTLEETLKLDYPHLQVIVVNDGSTDETLECAQAFLSDERVTVIDKRVNEGKAMAINDALVFATGDLILVMDADAYPELDALRWMAPHFVRNPRLAVVTGNPRVRNTQALLGKIQAVEFSSIISLLKRAQVVWGRIMTVSGVMALYRKSALQHVGLFVHDCATEDIATSWEFQRRFYDIRYEPRAQCRMQVPPTLRALWMQRMRWARGLAQVLRRNADIWTRWKDRRLYPVYLEAVLSIAWAYCFVILTIMWIVTWLAGAPLLGATPVPTWWGMLIGTASLLQLATGVLMDRRYDPSVTKYYFWASLYPLIYWIQMSVITVLATPAGILKPHGPGTWRTPRTAE